MGQPSAHIMLLFAAWLLASLPFLNQRCFGILLLPKCLNQHAQKKMIWRLFEWLIAYIIWLVCAVVMQKALGVYHTQTFFPFYPTVFILFILLALPAFIWRCLLKRV